MREENLDLRVVWCYGVHTWGSRGGGRIGIQREVGPGLRGLQGSGGADGMWGIGRSWFRGTGSLVVVVSREWWHDR